MVLWPIGMKTMPDQVRPFMSGKVCPLSMGERDLEALGTWLGVTELGLLVALTNQPFTSFPHPEDPLSRGNLVKEWLTSSGMLPAMVLICRTSAMPLRPIFSCLVL